jgi:MFS family permease
VTSTAGQTRSGEADAPRDASHTGSDRGFLALLGLPALGLTFAVTMVSTYLPVRVVSSATPLEIGVLVGGEGFFALFLPTLVGAWTDRTSARVGHRLRFLAVSALITTVALALVGAFGAVLVVGLSVALFYVGYYGYLAPYWALYPDLVPRDESGRSRGAESTWRLVGSALATIGGGFLLAVWTPLPFVLAAALVLATTLILARGLGDRRDHPLHTSDDSWRETLHRQWALFRQAGVGELLIANALWNFALAALRAFVVLFFVMGLGRSTSFVSAVIFPLAAIGFVAAPLSGKLADRIGHIRVLTVALVIYGGGLLIPSFLHASWVLVLIPVVAAGAATVMTLPYAVLIQLIDGDVDHGAASGLFGLSRGVGSLLGPLVVGAAVELTAGNLFDGTQGYGVLWVIIGAAVLISLPILRRVHLASSQSGSST